MTEKRFKVHSMIRGMDIGETMDLELCEELIKKYGSSSDIDLLITNNGNNMTYEEVADLLNENEHLKQSLKRQQSSNDECSKYIEEVIKENKQLKEEIKYLNDVLARYEENELFKLQSILK